MGDISGNIDVDELISFSNDLVEFLRDKKDISNLNQILEHSKALQSSCAADFDEVHSLLQDYQNKIDACKQKTDEAKSEVIADSEIDRLQKELEEEIEREHSFRQELRNVVNEINDLEHQRLSVEEQKQIQRKLRQEDLQAQRALSMYASVTTIIPMDDQFKISGHIVEREKKVVEKFEFDPTEASAFDICNNIWGIINR